MSKRTRVPPLMVPSDVATLSYIAGLFDGEGSVSINSIIPDPKYGGRSVSHRLTVNISNNDEAIMLWLMTVLGGSFSSAVGKLTTKKNYRWIAQGRNARAFLSAIKPYVRIKSERVELALAFLDLTLNRDTRHKGQYGAVRLQPQEVATRETMRQRMVLLNNRNLHKLAARA